MDDENIEIIEGVDIAPRVDRKLKSKYGTGRPGRPGGFISRNQILAAQSVSNSERESARKLGVSYLTYRKYAALHGLRGKVLNMGQKNVRKPVVNEDAGIYPLNKILEGKFPSYSTARLKVRLIRSKRMPVCCNRCGFAEKRITDGNVPVLLNYLDGDNTNKLARNLEFLCYNCYFLYVNNPVGHRKNFAITKDGATLDYALESAEMLKMGNEEKAEPNQNFTSNEPDRT